MLAPTHSLRARLTTLSALALLALPGAASTTWIVDDDGGPGVHFTDIPPALAAAGSKDLILVRPGSYSDFTVSVNVTILGEPGASTGDVAVDMASGRVLLAGLTTGTLTVKNCPQTVVLDGLTIGGPYANAASTVLVTSSPDVRFVDCLLTGKKGNPIALDGGDGLRVTGSRVELTTSLVQAGDGYQTSCEDGGFGGRGMKMAKASTVHAARSTVRAGKGGDTQAYLCVASAGPGGDGIEGDDGGDLILSGLAGDEIEGGQGGVMAFGSLGYCGDGGDALDLSATSVRRSGVTLIRGAAGCYGYFGGLDGEAVWLTNGATQTVAGPADPTLERLNVPVLGAPVTFRVHGAVGSAATLFLSRQPKVQTTAGVVGALLLTKMRTIPLGTIPAAGYVDKAIQLPGGWSQGALIVAQAECLYPGPELRRTNSVPLVLR